MATIIGDGGNNTLTGTLGSDWISGLGGDDSLEGRIDDTLEGGAGNDTLFVIAGDNIFIGFDGADLIFGGTGADTIVIAATSLDLNAASDAQFTNVEAVSAAGAASGVLIDLSNQFDPLWITGSSNADTLIGGMFQNTFIGFSGADFIDGNSALFANTISLTSTAADLNAAADAQIVRVQSVSAANAASGVSINLGNQTDGFSITGSGNADTLTGSAGNDSFLGFVGADFIDGDSGSDAIALFGTWLDLNNAADAQIVNIESVNVWSPAAAILVDLHNQTEDFSIFGNDYGDTLVGPSGNGSLAGGSGNDCLIGEAGNDIFTAGGGNDSLDGGDSDDTLTGDAGNDSLAGGAGTDTALYTAARVNYAITLNGSSITVTDTRPGSPDGTDEISAVENLQFTDVMFSVGPTGATFVGDGNDNAFLGTNGSDFLSGLEGSDTLNGGPGIDSMAGGVGNDSYTVDDPADIIIENPGEGSDRVNTALNAFTLPGEVERLAFTGTVFFGMPGVTYTGNAIINNITGAWGDDTISGLDGNDTLIGAFGNDYLTGGEANDRLHGDAGNDSLAGDNGNDVLDGGDDSDTAIYTGARWDYSISQNGLAFTIQDNRAGSPDGTDSVTNVENFQFSDGAVSAADLLDNDAPSTPADVDAAPNSVAEGAANGTAVGITALSTDVDGPATTYTLLDDAGGRFAIDANTGVVTVADASLLDFETNISHDITVQASDGFLQSPPQVFTIEVTDVTGVTINGTSAANMIGGTNEEDTINGLGGYDTISGLGGNDSLNGGAGNDTLSGGDDGDTLDGGGGNDSLDGGTDSSADWLMGGAGKDTLTGGDGNDTLNGGTAADSMTGGMGDDTYTVDNGLDVVTENSGEGVDTVEAARSSYTLGSNVENLAYIGATKIKAMGNELDNAITGGAGNDTLIGAAGADTVTGGLGADRFVFRPGDLPSGSPLDEITDFNHAELDRIDLKAIDANSNTLANEAFIFIGSDPFTHVARQLHYADNGNGGVTVEGDTNGDALADFQLTVDDTVSLAATDFFL